MGYEFEDYDEEPTQEEMEEHEGAEATKAKMTKKKLKIEFDTENFANGIVSAVTSEVKKNLETSIIEQIKKEVLDDLKEKIRLSTHEIIKDIIVDFMENEKIKIGGSSFWDDEPLKELTMLEYAKKCVGDSVVKGNFKVVTGYEKDRYSNSGYRAKTQEFTFSDYIRSQLAIGNDIKEYIDKQVVEIKNNVNRDVKKVFDDSTKKMLSESVLNVLMANDTYKKIESNLACIADRTVE